MTVGLARIVLHLPMSHSLKDKRHVMKSVIAQVLQRFQVAAAEVDRHEEWQIGVIGIACLSTSSQHADQTLARVFNFVEGRALDAQVLEYETEIVHGL